MNTYKDLSSAFNEFLTENNNDKKEINIEMFINRIKDIMPNLSDELLSQIFIYLSENKETINLNIIEINRKELSILAHSNEISFCIVGSDQVATWLYVRLRGHQHEP